MAAGLAFERVVSTASFRSEWLELAGKAPVTPFAFPGFFDAWCEAFGADRTGFVVAGTVNGRLEIVVPFWHENAHADRWNTFGAFRADYSEAVSRTQDPAVGSAFYRWLVTKAPCSSARIARAPNDSLLGRGIPASAFGRRGRAISAISTFLTSRNARYLTVHPHDEHPFADRLQIEALSDRISRSATRRNLKMLEKHGPVSYETVFETKALQTLLPTLFDMHVANFAGTERSSQFSKTAERALWQRVLAQPDLKGVVYMDVLRVGDRPVAMHLGFQHAKRIYYSKPTFDLALAKASPGKTLLAYLFARANAEKIERVDLLKGTESYKADWANHSRPTITTILVQRSARDLVRAMVRRS